MITSAGIASAMMKEGPVEMQDECLDYLLDLISCFSGAARECSRPSLILHYGRFVSSGERSNHVSASYYAMIRHWCKKM